MHCAPAKINVRDESCAGAWSDILHPAARPGRPPSPVGHHQHHRACHVATLGMGKSMRQRRYRLVDSKECRSLCATRLPCQPWLACRFPAENRLTGWCAANDARRRSGVLAVHTRALDPSSAAFAGPARPGRATRTSTLAAAQGATHDTVRVDAFDAIRASLACGANGGRGKETPRLCVERYLFKERGRGNTT